MNAQQKILTIVLIAFLVVALTAAVIFLQSPPALPKDSEKLQVVTSFFPMFDFAKNVGGDRAEVSILVPPGVEVHDWEPNTADVQNVLAADIFVYNGLGVEPWIDSIKDVTRSAGILFTEASAGLGAELLFYEEGGTDPHVWLDPVIAKRQVETILAVFRQVDPENADYYEENANQYLDRFDVLHQEINVALAEYSRREFISFHEAFSYFARRYDLVQLYLLSRGQEEPSPADLALIIDTAKTLNISVIYSEPLSDPALAQEVAGQIPNGRVLVLDPLEEVPLVDVEAGKDYFSIMRQNVLNLEEGLR